MRKAGVLSILLISVVVAAGAYLSSKISTYYQQEQLQAINDLNTTLQPENMLFLCDTESKWFGIVLNMTCTLERLDSPMVLLEVWHNIMITPVRLQGSFGIAPDKGFVLEFLDLGPLFYQQSGQWQFSLIKQQIQFTYQTGSLYSTSMPGTVLSLSPLIFSGYADINAPHHSQLTIQLADLTVEQPEQALELNNLQLQTTSLMLDGRQFIEEISLSLNSFEYEILGDHLTLQALSATQTNVLHINNLATFNKAELEHFRYRNEEGSLILSSNKLAFSLANLDWPTLKEISGNLELDAASSTADLAALLAKGMQFNLELLKSDFRDEDPAGNVVGPSGELILSGQAKLAAIGNQPELNPIDMRLNANFKLDLSERLLAGPQAELMQDFISQGWLQKQNDRLIANIQYKNAQLLSNGVLVSSLAMFPPNLESN